MDKSVMIENLVNYFTDGNKAKFASSLGISPQTLSKWISRSTFDAELIYSVYPQVSSNWLLTGKGEMIKTDALSSVSMSGDHNQVNGHGASGNINGASAEIAALKERNDSLERIIESKDAIIDTLRHQSETYERTIKYFTEKK